MNRVAYPLNWEAGWWLILAAFVTGAAIGRFFHRDDFLGGYGSFRRRIIRLGHIALAALGILNVIVSCLPGMPGSSWTRDAAASGFIVGGVTMPAVCFMTGWRESWRRLFVIPVLALVSAVVLMLMAGTP